VSDTEEHRQRSATLKKKNKQTETLKSNITSIADGGINQNRKVSEIGRH